MLHMHGELPNLNIQIRQQPLLDNMIHKGKLMYFVDALLPEMHDSIKNWLYCSSIGLV